jgi:hypothetical protein
MLFYYCPSLPRSKHFPRQRKKPRRRTEEAATDKTTRLANMVASVTRSRVKYIEFDDERARGRKGGKENE